MEGLRRLRDLTGKGWPWDLDFVNSDDNLLCVHASSPHTMPCHAQCEVEADGSPSPNLLRSAVKFLAGKDIHVQTVDDAIEHEGISHLIEQAIAEYNKNDAISHAQQLGKWRILPRDLSEKNGEMTPSLKVCWAGRWADGALGGVGGWGMVMDAQ